MAQIRINTDHVAETGRWLTAQGGRLAEIGQELERAIGELDLGAWDGISRQRAEPSLARVQPASMRLSRALDALGRTLVRVAEIFEQEDNTAARRVDGLAMMAWNEKGTLLPASPPDGNPDFSDVPGADEAEYGTVEGELFIAGPADGSAVHPNDLTQGRIGDCYLIAALAALARSDPDLIRRMIRDNGDGTYTVTFYQQRGPFAFWQPEYTPVEVTVTPDFPLDGREPIFVRPGDTSGGQRELWPMIVEKAYAQYRGGYDNIIGGWGGEAMETLTGVPSEWYSPAAVDIQTLAQYNAEGSAITASSLFDYKLGELWDIPDRTDTNPWYTDGMLIDSHEYYITDVDLEAGTVTLQNPHGWGAGIVMPYEDFQVTFQRVSVNHLGNP